MADELAALDEKTALDDSIMDCAVLWYWPDAWMTRAMLIQSTGLTDRSLRDVVVPIC